MASAMSRSWWGQNFLQALERFTNPARLGRGRGYARSGRIKSWEVKDNRVTAKIRGKVNPYFGVHTEPLYTTSVSLQTLSGQQWAPLIQTLGNRAGLITHLLLGEMPDTIEEAFQGAGLHLLPANSQDFNTRCSCPDDANPCKHVAALCYVLAEQLDRDPILLFELRGLSRQALRTALLDTSLGQALAASLDDTAVPEPAPVDSLHTRPRRLPADGFDAARFWGEPAALPGELPAPAPPGLAAAIIRKGGDYPPFWGQDRSFVAVMAELYERVRKHNRDI